MFIRPKLAYGRQDLAGVALRAPSAQLGRGECSFFVKDTQTYTHTLNHNLYIIIIIAVAAPDITAFCQKLGLEKLLSMLIKQLKGTFPLKILCPNALIWCRNGVRCVSSAWFRPNSAPNISFAEGSKRHYCLSVFTPFCVSCQVLTISLLHQGSGFWKRKY